MESLIGILVAVAVVVFKLIAKSMEDSAASPARPAPPRPMPQGLPSQESMPQRPVPSPYTPYPEPSSYPEPSPYQEPDFMPESDIEICGEPIGDGVFDMSEALYEEAKPVTKVQNDIKKSVLASTLANTPDVSEPKEKIDPKKLIIYSEIMNRKY